MMAAHSAGEYRILRRYQGGEADGRSGKNVKDVKAKLRIAARQNYRRALLGDYCFPRSTSGGWPGGCSGKKRKVVLTPSCPTHQHIAR
jgi:hypothetical protein